MLKAVGAPLPNCWPCAYQLHQGFLELQDTLAHAAASHSLKRLTWFCRDMSAGGSSPCTAMGTVT